MHSKIITTNLLTIAHPLVEPITSLAKPKASLEAYFSIRKLTWTVTSSEPVISPSLLSFFFFCNMLRFNRYWWGTVESRVRRGRFILPQIMPFIKPYRHERHHPLVNGYYLAGQWKAASKYDNLSTCVWWHLLWVLLINAAVFEDKMVFCKEGWDAWLRGCVYFKAIKLRGTLKTLSSSIILSSWAVIYPDTSTPLPPCAWRYALGGGPGLHSLWPKFC